MVKMFKTKKGDPTDVLIFCCLLFVIAVGLVVVIVTTSHVKDSLDSSVIAESEHYNQSTQPLENLTTTGINKGFVFLFIGMIISMFILSFMIKVHPAFIVIYFIILVFTIFIGMIVGNTYESLIEDDSISSFSANYPTISWIMGHIAEILIIVGILNMIIIFAKPVGAGSGEV